MDGKPNSISQAKPLRPEGLLGFAKVPPVVSGSAKADLKAPEHKRVKVEPYFPPPPLPPPPPNFTFPKLRCPWPPSGQGRLGFIDVEAFQPHFASYPTVRALREAAAHPGSKDKLGGEARELPW